LRASTKIAESSPRFVFYGGKGGVGKTTSAAARAVAEAAAGRRVLLVSTDPAHSLGDALGVALSSNPKAIRRTLHAVELDAPRAFARWLEEHRQPLGEILEHGTWLDSEDVEALLDVSIPGIDELVGLLEVARLAGLERQARKARDHNRALRAPRASRSKVADDGYDLVVVDTAPTGHTLRLLAAPEAVAAVAEILDLLQAEHRVIREQLARIGRPEAADRLIALLAGQARDTAARLRDREQTAFHWVTLPEELSLAESVDAIEALERDGLHVPEVVVNRVLPDAPPCPICDRRRKEERRVVAATRRRLGRGRQVRVIHAALEEPRGLAALARLAKGDVAPLKRRPATERAPDVGRPFRAGGFTPPESLDAIKGASLLFFGGKGGVGKTTVAAAAALRLARANRASTVLLLSTDPAHSLADVFKHPVGDKGRAIKGGPRNLVVRELDAPAALAARRAQFEESIDEIASAVGASSIAGNAAPAQAGVSVHSPASAAARELMNLAPPGIDELFGIISVVDARAEFDVIVVDTAPTGHALRLLEMPDAAREWMQVLLRVLLKYRSLVRPGQLAAELVEVSKSIRGLQALLRDARQTRFVVVTRAAEVPRKETERLLAQLRRLRLSTPAVVFNALTMTPGRCMRCRATAAAEEREIGKLRVPRGCAIIRTPLAAPPPRGLAALRGWAASWSSVVQSSVASRKGRRQKSDGGS
jgi:arsenite-transporting ATPase